MEFTVLISLLGILALAALVPVSEWLDRTVGSGQMGRTKPVLIGTAAFLGVGYLAGFGILGALAFALCFPIWRTPGFPARTIDPTTDAQERKALQRHLVFSLPLVGAAWLAGAPLWLLPWVALCMVAFAWKAAKLARQNGEWYMQGLDKNDITERARGRMYGLAVALAMIPVSVAIAMGYGDSGNAQVILDLFKSRS